MYLPLRGSQTTIWLLGSKPELISKVTKGQAVTQLTLEGKVADLKALVGALLSRDDGRITDERVVDARVGHKVGLELVQINVEVGVIIRLLQLLHIPLYACQEKPGIEKPYHKYPKLCIDLLIYFY